MGLEQEAGGVEIGVLPSLQGRTLREGVESHWGTYAEGLPALILFSSEFAAPVSVPVQEILDVICRTLSISAKNIVSLSSVHSPSGPRAARKVVWNLKLPKLCRP